MNISLSLFAPENLVSRDGFGSSPVPRQPAHLHTQAESLVLTIIFILLGFLCTGVCYSHIIILHAMAANNVIRYYVV